MHVAITGASSGIGLALTKIFGQYASRISLVARRKNIPEKEAKYLGIPYYVDSVDLSRVDSCTQWIDRAQEANGEIDVLINNAGMQLVGRALEHSEEQIDMMLNLNLLSPVKMIHYLLPQMLKRQSGAIINIASMAAINHVPGMAHYAATKSGLAAFSEALRLEYRELDVLTVYPGPIETPMADKAQEKYDNPIAKMLPAASAEDMAAKIYKYFKQKKGRLYYPHIYRLQTITPPLAQWFIEHFAPMPKK